MTLVKRADELSIGDIGRTVRSQRYRTKNKTEKPMRALYSGDPTPVREFTYTIESIYAHQNGTIVINQNAQCIYLRPDTLIYMEDGQWE